MLDGDELVNTKYSHHGRLKTTSYGQVSALSRSADKMGLGPASALDGLAKSPVTVAKISQPGELGSFLAGHLANSARLSVRRLLFLSFFLPVGGATRRERAIDPWRPSTPSKTSGVGSRDSTFFGAGAPNARHFSNCYRASVTLPGAATKLESQVGHHLPTDDDTYSTCGELSYHRRELNFPSIDKRTFNTHLLTLVPCLQLHSATCGFRFISSSPFFFA
jgi:hypothetical protein